MNKIVRKYIVKYLVDNGIDVKSSRTVRVKRSAEPEMPTYMIVIVTDEGEFGFDYFHDGSGKYGILFFDRNDKIENLIREWLKINKVIYWDN